MLVQEYYLLALSQKSVRFYKVHKKQITKIESDLLPKDIDEALWMDDPEISIQHHPNSSSDMAFHGHGTKKEYKQINLERFLKILDKSLNTLIADKTLPLILFCDKSVFPIYKKVNSYPQLEGKFVQGNPDKLKRKELVYEVNKEYELR